MKKKKKIWISTLIIIGVSLFVMNCKKELIKNDPIITWANPADIVFGSTLTSSQLNATSDIPGTFIYSPKIGVYLNIGANQILSVDFTPSDLSKYNPKSKTVKINVVLSQPVFNPSKTYGTMTDQDGNVYKTISIGTQTWMAENLRTTKYNDNSDIPKAFDATGWHVLTTPGVCTYNNTNNIDTINTYGRLYNWYAVNTGKLAPKGWHVPSYNEWYTLVNYLGGDSIDAYKLKEAGTYHWKAPNKWADNSSGFTAIPGGDGFSDGNIGKFLNIEKIGFYWSSSEYSTNPNDAWNYEMYSYQNQSFVVSGGKVFFFSVRCLKDN